MLEGLAARDKNENKILYIAAKEQAGRNRMKVLGFLISLIREHLGRTKSQVCCQDSGLRPHNNFNAHLMVGLETKSYVKSTLYAFARISANGRAEVWCT